MQTIETKKNRLSKVGGFKQNLLILLFSLTSISAYSAGGGVGLNSTRIIYNQGEKSASIGARNNTDINYLAKFMVNKSPDGLKGDAPFTVTPPLVKVDSGKTQEVKIYGQTHNLPTDRESIFYFSATMIPATNGPVNGAALNIGYNNVIKLFYRPGKLPVSPKEAHEQLKIESSATGITVVNNSPYYISLSNLSVNGVKVDMSMKKRNTMISPYDSFSYITPANGRKGVAKWTVINDLGGEDVYHGQVH
ncbi:molecular chaperone [Providencia vermicola]|uniref:Molecular chaperone n=4 Tax=Providencia TaxID=586 RepID=A0ABD5L5Z5_PROST|nr:MULTISPECIES: molecular chaperone [Providencia]ELR5122953.1 molecular chaperone [Providencia stuartii]ELR5293256.1 molecular chaperone [Providencia stuartii]ELX8379867.1 molecular chaperone [Providencia stuartii]ELZ5941070.1 molecular chaperone [Providencia stuartii]EMD5259257.1 molecular chaperone [Providencia stuartii]